jgi:hypothetical protein
LEVILFRHIAHTATSLTLAAIGSLFLSAGVNPAQAQGNAHYVATIPFDFGMHDAVFPAGTYQITPLSQKMLRLDLVGGTRMGYLMVFPADDASNVATGRLKFTRYGDLYFLRQFSAPKEGREWAAVSRCVPSTNEKRVAKEWMARAHAPGGVDVAVNSADQH